MKFLTYITFILSLTVFAATSQAKTIVAGVSPYQSANELNAEVKALVKFALEAEAGDTVIIMDAYHLKTIATIAIPADKKYRSPKARFNKNKQSIAKLLAFSKQPAKADSAPRVHKAMRLPQFLRHVARTVNSKDQIDIVVLGSLLYDTSEDAAFSMADGLIAGDGHLQRTRAESVYGTAGQTGLLNNVRLHWAYPEDQMQSDRHAHRIERFWHLYVTQLGGTLVSYANDLQSVLSNVKAGANPLKHEYQLEDTDRLEMIRLRAVEMSTSIYEQPITTQAPEADQIVQVNNVTVGITWKTCLSCDLDLYVRPFEGAQPLYFANNQTENGVYLKDFRASPAVGAGGFETIELSTAVTLSAMKIAINFYSGQSHQSHQSVDGEIRLSFNGQTYAKPFSLMARAGNKGAGVLEGLDGASLTPHTLLIDPLTIVGLTNTES